MADLNRRCIGTVATAGGNTNEVSIRSASAANTVPWVSRTLQAKTIEIFWYMTSTGSITQPITSTAYNQQLIAVRSSGSSSFEDDRFNFRVYAWSLSFPNVVMRTVVRDNNGARITLDATLPLSNNLNVWWHTVICKQDNNSTSPWIAFHGRVGRDVNGNATTADSLGASYITSVVTSGTGTSMYGFRDTTSATTTVWLGGISSTFTGTTIVSSSVFRGGIAELRVWSDNRLLVNPFGANGLNDLRDQFIDAVAFPTLLHCFRLNEPNGTTVLNFDDVGSLNAQFTTNVQETTNVGFASHPFPPGTTGIVDMGGASGVAVASAASPGIQRAFALVPGGATAQGIANTPGLRRAFALVPGSAVGEADSAAPGLTNALFVTPTAAIATATSAAPGITNSLFLTPGTAVALGGIAGRPDFSVTGGGGGSAIDLVPVAAVAQGLASTPDTRLAFALSPGAAVGAGSAAAAAVGIGMVVQPSSATAVANSTAAFVGGTLAAEIRETERITATLMTLEAWMSVLDIWNVALTRLGIETVTSAPSSDGSPQGVVMASNWALFKETFLRDDAWDGGKKTASLSTFKEADGTTSVTPTARWNYAYQLPSDHVRSLRLNGLENQPGDKSVSGMGLWEEEVVANAAGTRRRCLLADDATAALEYVFLVPDNEITLMPADMRWAMAMSLAAHVATAFGKTTNEIAQIEDQAEIARRNARRTDSATGTKPTLTDASIANAFW